jgi:type VI secretion system protein ImpF
MAELTPKELLQPSLLDRLTDDERDQKQESRMKRVLSPARLRECVRRDLAWLFNTTNLACMDEQVAELPEVARSVLNYGLPDFTGRTASSVDVPALERLLRNAIWQFEPRLLRNSVRVHLNVDDAEMSHNAMTFSIEAELWAQPLPLRLFFRTDIDLETGEVDVAETGKAATS